MICHVFEIEIVTKRCTASVDAIVVSEVDF